MYANHIKHLLLLIPGRADNNSGVFPLQGEHYYNALIKCRGNYSPGYLLKCMGYAVHKSIMYILWKTNCWQMNM